MRLCIKLGLIAAAVLGVACAPASDHEAAVGKSVRQALEASHEVHVAVVISPPGEDSAALIDDQQAIREIQDSVAALLPEGEAEITHRFQGVPGLGVKLKSVLALDLLASHENVQAIDEDIPGSGTLDQTRPIVGAHSMFAAGARATGRVVGVIDTGIDAAHSALKDDVRAEACRCKTMSDCCPNHSASQTGPGAALDDFGHGTHVSGIISSSGSGAPRGIAPDTDLVVVRMMKNNEFGGTADIVDSLDWIASAHPEVDAVNLSVATFAVFPADCEKVPGHEAYITDLYNAVERLRLKGIPVIVAAGNTGAKNAMPAPGCLSNVISVGNVLDNLTANETSNATATLDIFAPGTDVISAAMNGGSISMTGTSMATPHVTAAVALIKQANPSASVEQIQDCLSRSNRHIWDGGFDRPLLHIPTAVAACGGGVPVPARIQAEDYVDHRDLSFANLGGKGYRNDDVDIATITENGSDFYVGWTDEQEWLEYTVTTLWTANHDISLRLAAMETGKKVSILVDDAAVATLDVPVATWLKDQEIQKRWTTFQTKTKTNVKLAAGKHRIRIRFDSKEVNMDWLEVRPSRTFTVPSTRIEAEFYARYGRTDATTGEDKLNDDSTVGNVAGACRLDNVDLQFLPTTESDGVCNVGYTSAREWLEYDIRPSTTRTFSIALRAVAGAIGKTVKVQLDGVEVETVQPAVDSTYKTYQETTLSKTVTITAGTTHKLRVSFPNGGVALNYLSVK